jgi:hypothetical protein
MPYHVQVRRPFRRAWAFNLSEPRVYREIVDPWRGGRAFTLGGRWWPPADCEVRIIEGDELSPPELAYGRGWNTAERNGKDVTRRLFGIGEAPEA